MKKTDAGFRTFLDRTLGLERGHHGVSGSNRPKPVLAHNRRKVPWREFGHVPNSGLMVWLRRGKGQLNAMPPQQLAGLVWLEEIELHLEIESAKGRLVQPFNQIR